MGNGFPLQRTNPCFDMTQREKEVTIFLCGDVMTGRGIGLIRGKPVIYGCGDFINDYEGISGNEEYRSDLGLMYFVSLNASDGTLAKLIMAPTKIKKFRVNKASEEDAEHLLGVLNREGQKLGTHFILRSDGFLELASD